MRGFGGKDKRDKTGRMSFLFSLTTLQTKLVADTHESLVKIWGAWKKGRLASISLAVCCLGAEHSGPP